MPCRRKAPFLAVLLAAFALPAAAQTPTVTRVVPAFGPASGGSVVIVVGSGFAAGATVTFGGTPATSVSVSNATTLTARAPVRVPGSVTVAVTNPGGASGSRANGYRFLAPTGTFGITTFPVTSGAVTDVAAGADGNLWFLNNGGEDAVPWSVSKMTPAGVFTDYPQFPAGLLTDIAPGPDGNLWYTRMRGPFGAGGAAVGKITLSGVSTEYPIAAASDPRGIAAGPDGAVWFGESYDTVVGRMTTGGSLTEFTVDTRPFGITLGPDGALWLAGLKKNGYCLRLLPGGQYQDFPIPNLPGGKYPEKIVTGADGNLWFQFSGHLAIGRLTPAGAYTEFTLTTGFAVHDIASGVDGNLWFTNSDFAFDTRVGRLTPSGQVTTWPLPIGSYPRGIAAGPDGALWFANGYNVGRVNPGAPPPGIERITPGFGPDSGGTSVTISGTGFAAGATVKVGGVPATGVTVVDPATITATTGPHVAGTVDVTVTNPGAAPLTLPASFFYSPAPAAARFFPLTPCRILDTRNPNGPHGGPVLGAGGSRRTFVLAGACGVPPAAKSVSANVTITGPLARGSLAVFPGNAIPTGTTTIEFGAGRTRANNAMLYLATDGAGSIGVQNDAPGSVHFIVDVNGYFR